MIVEKMILKYQAEIALRHENLQLFLKNPSGVPEHPDFVATIEEQLKKIAEITDLLEAAQDSLSFQ